MKIISKTKYNDMFLSIVEVVDPMAIIHFNRRYNLILIKDNKNIFPKDKHKYFTFNENSKLYPIKSSLTIKTIYINQLLYYKLKICDKTYEECLSLIKEFIRSNLKITKFYKNFTYV